MERYLAGACGIYCGACDHYLATQETGKHLIREGASRQTQLLAHPCEGCKTDHPERLCRFCRECVIRLCAKDKGIGSCGECGEFPCGDIAAFRENKHAHKREAYKNIAHYISLGEQRWLEDRKRRWSCSACGAPHGFYEQACGSCGAALDALCPDLRN